MLFRNLKTGNLVMAKDKLSEQLMQKSLNYEAVISKVPPRKSTRKPRKQKESGKE